ncbi:MAG: DUF1697 domain-containing protein [Pseudomonadota bacterium]|nr:DUF1697 domain-containing protein [Pseudomonadota bacterium]
MPTTHIALLRGVMPSGKNAVKMAALREVLTQGGFADVRTWIQSGNVALTTDLSAQDTAREVRRLIHEKLGPDLPVIVKTPRQLQAVLAKNPFADGRHDIKRVFVALANEPLDAACARALLAQDCGDEQLAITEAAAYLYIPGSAARSRLGLPLLEKSFGLAMTTRNLNTLSKMAGF